MGRSHVEDEGKKGAEESTPTQNEANSVEGAEEDKQTQLTRMLIAF